MMVLVLLDSRTISGRREVTAMSKLPLQVHSQLPVGGSLHGRGWVLATVPVLWALSPSLTKVMASGGWAYLLLTLTRCCSTHLAISMRTLSCLHLYRPSAKAFGQPVRIWFSVQETAPHWLHDGSSSPPQIFRSFLGVGSRSVTECRRKLNLPWSICHSSFHDSGHSYAWSHYVHRPWEASPIAFTWRSSSAASRTLCTTRPLLALASALLHLFSL